MTLISIGDLSQGLALRRQNAATKGDLQRLTAELASGRTADVATRLSGNLAPLAGVDAALGRLEGYGQVAAEMGRRAASVQQVLGRVDDAARVLGPTLLTSGQGRQEATIDGAARQAAQALEQVVGALNLRVGDRSVMAGAESGQPALVSAGALLDRAVAVTQGAAGAADVEAALRAWMDDPAGFRAEAYRGGQAPAAVAVAEDEAVRLDATADDPALKATLGALLMGALLTRGVFAGQTEARAGLAQRAGEALAETAPARAHLAARVGLTEERIAAAQVRNAAERSSLQLERNSMVEADGYDTATGLQQAQARLETLYTLTARLSRLNLADYL